MIAHDLRRDIKNMVDDLCLQSYNEGVEATVSRLQEPVRGEAALKQIDRMARQIEECHATLRRRNAQIDKLESELRIAQAIACTCAGDEC